MAAVSPRRTQGQRRNETERRVLDAAVSLIANKGSHSITLAQVGLAAGYSRAIVHHHFRNRGGLLEAVMRELGGIDVPDYRGSALRQIVEMIEGYLDNLANSSSTTKAFVRLWGESMASDPVLTPLFDQRDVAFRALLTDLIRAGVDDGSIGAAVDAEIAAVVILGLARGVGVQLMSDTPPQPPLRSLIDATTRSIVAALGVSGS